MLQDALNAEQAQHKNTREDQQKRLEQISAEANARTEELKSERDKTGAVFSMGILRAKPHMNDHHLHRRWFKIDKKMFHIFHATSWISVGFRPRNLWVTPSV